MTYIPDPIERGEASAERAYDELEQPNGMFKCYQCNAIFNPENEGGTLSPDPYAMPVCGACLQKEMCITFDSPCPTSTPSCEDSNPLKPVSPI